MFGIDQGESEESGCVDQRLLQCCRECREDATKQRGDAVGADPASRWAVLLVPSDFEGDQQPDCKAKAKLQDHQIHSLLLAREGLPSGDALDVYPVK
jgi:hypothetical protein